MNVPMPRAAGLGVALALIVGILLGAATVFLVLRASQSKVEVDLKSLQHQILTNREAINHADLHILELKALSSLPADPARARQAAVDYAVNSANASNIVPPTQKEFDDKKLDKEETKRLNDAATQSAEELAKAAGSLGDIDDCAKLATETASILDPASYKNGAQSTVTKNLQDCKKQLDAKRAALADDAKAKCQKDPQSQECTKAKEKLKQADDAEKLIRVLLVIAGLVAIAYGEPELGLLLLTMANAHGSEGGDGGGQGDADGSGQKTANSSTSSETTPAPQTQTAAIGGDFGSPQGGDIICNGGASLSCSKPGAGTIEIDLSGQGDSPHADLARITKDVVANKDGKSLIVCPSGQSDDGFLKGFVLTATDTENLTAYYLIGLKRTASKKFQVVYPTRDQRSASPVGCDRIGLSS